MANIIIIDDDLAMEILMENLRYRGHDAKRIGTSQEALNDIEALLSANLVILDIIMPWPTGRAKSEVSGSRTAGMEILRELRNKSNELPIVVYSATQDADLIKAIMSDKNATFISKWGMSSLEETIGKINIILGLEETSIEPISFIVHGRNDLVKLELKNYLQNTLNLPEPIILHEQPDLGRTIIEKFENYAMQSSLVFVLLTPDDLGSVASESNDLKRRARQNVIFEMGYFIGMLGRTSGRVFLLHKGPIELPSDLSGVVYIDIANGIESVGEHIRREIESGRKN